MRKPTALLSVLVVVFFLVISSAGVEITHVFLNSTSGNFLLGDNIWAATNLDSTPSSKLIYSWRLNSNPFASLILTFENDTKTLVKDYSGYGNSGEPNNTFINSTGGHDRFGGAEFNGKNSSIVFQDTPSLRANQNLTITAWIKLGKNPANYSFILEKGRNDTDNYAFFIDYTGTSRLDFEYNATSYHLIRSSPIGFEQGRWYFVAVAVNKTRIRFFVNNSLAGEFQISDPLIERNFDLFVGKQNYHPSDLYFNGTIDDLTLFKKSISNEQIYSIYFNNSKEIVSKETSRAQSWVCCVTASNISEEGSEVCSNPETIQDKTPPSITINSPTAQENLSTLKILLNVSISELGTINYSLDDSQNQTLCSSCEAGYSEIDLSSFGNHTLKIFAFDISGNSNYTFKNFTANRDTDSDGIPDKQDNDDDNDGLNDSEDKLNGNASNVNTNLENLNLTVAGSSNLSQKFEGVKLVQFKDSQNPIVEFNFNFSGNRTLNLADIVIKTQENGDSCGKLLIKGINLEGTGFTKTVYLQDISSQKNKVCIKDEEVASISEISEYCSGSGEVKLSCPGASGSYTCEIVSGYYKISGLTHSLVIETMDYPSENQNSPQSHSAGGCATNWICTDWSPCQNKTQKRICSKEKDYCSAPPKPPEKRACNESKKQIEIDIPKTLLENPQDLEATVILNSNETAEIVFKITDSKGQIVFSKEVQGVGRISETFSNLKLPAGEYSLIIEVAVGKTTKTFRKSFTIIRKTRAGLEDVLVIFIFLILLIIWWRLRNE